MKQSKVKKRKLVTTIVTSELFVEIYEIYVCVRNKSRKNFGKECLEAVKKIGCEMFLARAFFDESSRNAFKLCANLQGALLLPLQRDSIPFLETLVNISVKKRCGRIRGVC